MIEHLMPYFKMEDYSMDFGEFNVILKKMDFIIMITFF